MNDLKAIVTATRAAARAVPAIQRARRAFEQAQAEVAYCTEELRHANRCGFHEIRRRYLWNQLEDAKRSLPRLRKTLVAAEFRLFKAQQVLNLNPMTGDDA